MIGLSSIGSRRVVGTSALLVLGAMIPLMSGAVSHAATPKNLLTTKRLIVHKEGYGPTATCPAGYVMTGGGVTSGSPTSWVDKDQPKGNGWTGSAYTSAVITNDALNYSGPDAVTVYAICMKKE